VTREGRLWEKAEAGVLLCMSAGMPFDAMQLSAAVLLCVGVCVCVCLHAYVCVHVRVCDGEGAHWSTEQSSARAMGLDAVFFAVRCCNTPVL